MKRVWVPQVIAGLMLIRGGVLAPPRPIGVEEMLVTGIDREAVSTASAPDPSSDVVTFASESF